MDGNRTLGLTQLGQAPQIKLDRKEVPGFPNIISNLREKQSIEDNNFAT
jgi:hypothetical protein